MVWTILDILRVDSYVHMGLIKRSMAVIYGLNPGGRGTPLYGLYGDMPLGRVWFLASLP